MSEAYYQEYCAGNDDCPRGVPDGIKCPACPPAEIASRPELKRQDFRWRTMDGDILTLDEMATKHIFNSMKMCFNHLAAAWGAKPVWFVKHYGDYASAAVREPRQLAWLVVFFILEIDRRGDLPERYSEPYQQIKDQLTARNISAETVLLEESKC